MGLMKQIFKTSNLKECNSEIKSWMTEVLLAVEKVSGPLGIYNCTVQVVDGNALQIHIQDWYDDLIMKCGKEYGLEKYFNLKPVEGYSGIYTSLLTPHIAGNAKSYLKKVMEEIEIQYHLGYEFDNRIGAASKNYK